MPKRKECNNKGFVIVFLMLVVFALPCVSFATSFSDLQPGKVDNTLKMSLDSSGSVGSDDIQNHRPRHGQEKAPFQATPIPSAVWLLGTGLVGLWGISRKLRK